MDRRGTQALFALVLEYADADQERSRRSTPFSYQVSRSTITSMTMPVGIRVTLPCDLYDHLQAAALPDRALKWLEEWLALGEDELAFEEAVFVAADHRVPLPAELRSEVFDVIARNHPHAFNDGFLEVAARLRAE